MTPAEAVLCTSWPCPWSKGELLILHAACIISAVTPLALLLNLLDALYLIMALQLVPDLGCKQASTQPPFPASSSGCNPSSSPILSLSVAHRAYTVRR